MLQFKNDAWTPKQWTGTDNVDWKGVWGESGDNVWFVGSSGSYLHMTIGPSPAVQVLPDMPTVDGTTADLIVVWGFDKANVWMLASVKAAFHIKNEETETNNSKPLVEGDDIGDFKKIWGYGATNVAIARFYGPGSRRSAGRKLRRRATVLPTRRLRNHLVRQTELLGLDVWDRRAPVGVFAALRWHEVERRIRLGHVRDDHHARQLR